MSIAQANSEATGSDVYFDFYDDQKQNTLRRQFKVQTFYNSRAMLINDLCNVVKDSLIVAMSDC